VAFTALEAIFNTIPDLASPAEVQASLRSILGDETLEVYWWDREGECYVDVADEPVLPGARPGRVITPVAYESRKVALFAHAPRLLDHPWFLPVFVPTMRIALERDRLYRDLSAKIDQLRASRQRLIEASMAERRRLERNLHDGAQQRLIAVLLGLRALETRLAAAGELRASSSRLPTCATSPGGSLRRCSPSTASRQPSAGVRRARPCRWSSSCRSTRSCPR